MEESSSLPSEVVPIGESIGPVGASGPGPDLVGAFGQTEPDAPADAAADNGNGNGNGKEVEHVVARRFSSGWNRLLDPHHVRDKDFTFPGWNGLPFRGSIPSLKETDPEIRASLEAQLRHELGRAAERDIALTRRLGRRWRAEMPFAPFDMFLMLEPGVPWTPKDVLEPSMIGLEEPMEEEPDGGVPTEGDAE